MTLSQMQSLELFQTGGTDMKHPTKHPLPLDHRPALKPPLSRSLTLLLQPFSASSSSLINKLKLKSSKVRFVLSALYVHSSHDERLRLFLRQL